MRQYSIASRTRICVKEYGLWSFVREGIKELKTITIIKTIIKTA